ncbi:MAG TPA: hypothetical protein GXZ90_08010, partial [Clostridiales bacterium]|nr:hypothetical protein [Clostridiales bacterium]
MGKHDSNSITQVAYFAINTYYSELNIEPIDLEVEFIDDLYKRRLELAIDENDKNNVKKN